MGVVSCAEKGLLVPDDILAQYGAIGAIAIAALYAVKIMYDRLQESYAREKDRADRLEEELRKLNEMVREDYVTTINKASQAISEANRAVADALASVRRT